MKGLEVSGAVRLIYKSLGVRGLRRVRATSVAVGKQKVLHILSVWLLP